jgi:hypothetical protein
MLRAGNMTVIVHSESGFSLNNATLEVDLKNASIVPDDPATLFTAAAVLSSSTYDGKTGGIAPTLRTSGFVANRIGPMLALFMTVSQVAAGAVTATISVKITGRDT